MRKLNSLTQQKWINVALLALLLFVCLGFCSTPKGLYLSAVTDALKIKRSVFSLATSCRYIVTAIVNLFFGTMIAKFGAKKLILAGISCFFIETVLSSFASSMPLFFIAEIFAGIGFSWAGTTVVSCVINRLFDSNRGKITGAVLCTNGLGGALAVQILSPLIFDGQNAFGYRNAYRLVALFLAVLFLLVLVFFSESSSEQAVKTPQQVKKKTAKGQRWAGIAFPYALRRPCFWGAIICIFCVGMALQGTGGIAAARMIDAGLDPKFVSSVASFSALSLAFSKLLAGFLYDKCGLRITVTVCVSAAALQMFFLCAVAPTGAGMTLAVLYSVSHAISLPLTTVILPIYANDFFGERDYDRIMSTFISFNVLGYACGGPLLNLFYDTLGSYTPILMMLGALMLAVFVTIHLVISAARKERLRIEKCECET